MAIIAILINFTSLPGPGDICHRENVSAKREGGFAFINIGQCFRMQANRLPSNPVLYKQYVDNNYKLPSGCDRGSRRWAASCAKPVSMNYLSCATFFWVI